MSMRDRAKSGSCKEMALLLFGFRYSYWYIQL